MAQGFGAFGDQTLDLLRQRGSILGENLLLGFQVELGAPEGPLLLGEGPRLCFESRSFVIEGSAA